MSKNMDDHVHIVEGDTTAFLPRNVVETQPKLKRLTLPRLNTEIRIQIHKRHFIVYEINIEGLNSF